MPEPVVPRPPGPPGQSGDPSRLRICDDDRHQVADLLRDAAGEGRIDFEELDERLTATYAAKTFADLVPITSDLPMPGSSVGASTPSIPTGFQPSGAQLPVTRHESTMAIFAGSTRNGMWEVGESHTAFAMMGGVEIDLREARFTVRETVISANAICGGIDIYVNAHTHVIIDGTGVMGGFDQGRDRVEPQLDAGSPVVRIKGVALMGGVTVTRREMPGDEKPRWSLRRRR